MTALASARAVRFRYAKRSPWLLDGVSLAVAPGDRVGVVGPNGCGESTLTRLLLGLLRPNEGTVEMFGRAPHPRRHVPALGYVGDPGFAEGFLALPPELPLGTLIDVYSFLYRPLDRPDELLAGLQLAALLPCPIFTLSKGQRQRVLAFLALAKRPALLVGDEATEGLDRDAHEFILRRVELLADAGTAVLWVSHRPDEIARLCRRVYEVRDGKLASLADARFRCTIESDGEPRDLGTITGAGAVREVGNALLRSGARSVRFAADREDAADA